MRHSLGHQRCFCERSIHSSRSEISCARVQAIAAGKGDRQLCGEADNMGAGRQALCVYPTNPLVLVEQLLLRLVSQLRKP